MDTALPKTNDDFGFLIGDMGNGYYLDFLTVHMRDTETRSIAISILLGSLSSKTSWCFSNQRRHQFLTRAMPSFLPVFVFDLDIFSLLVLSDDAMNRLIVKLRSEESINEITHSIEIRALRWHLAAGSSYLRKATGGYY